MGAGDYFVAHRDAGCVDGLGIARYQRMPFIQFIARCNQSVSACIWQPVHVGDVIRCQGDAARVALMAVCVDGAPAFGHVQKPAGDGGIVHLAAGLVLVFLQAADAASVAQGFPLFGRELLQWFIFPKGQGHGVYEDSLLGLT